MPPYPGHRTQPSAIYPPITRRMHQYPPQGRLVSPPQPYAESGKAVNPPQTNQSPGPYGFKPMAQIKRYQPNLRQRHVSNYSFRPLPMAASSTPYGNRVPAGYSQQPTEGYGYVPYGQVAEQSTRGRGFNAEPALGVTSEITYAEGSRGFAQQEGNRHLPKERDALRGPMRQHDRVHFRPLRSSNSTPQPLAWRPNHKAAETVLDAPQFAYGSSPLQ